MAGGQLWGALFFVFMTFAALSTVIAVFQNIISFATDLTGCSVKKAVFWNVIVIILLSMPCVLGFNVLSGIQPLGPGTTIQDLEDFIVSNNLLPIGSVLYLLFCTSRYGWGFKNFVNEANEGEGIAFPTWARVYVSYILPLIVLFILIEVILDNLQMFSKNLLIYLGRFFENCKQGVKMGLNFFRSYLNTRYVGAFLDNRKV